MLPWLVTVVAQWAKAPGIHCYVADSIPAVTPRYCTNKLEKCSLEHKKYKGKKIYATVSNRKWKTEAQAICSIRLPFAHRGN